MTLESEAEAADTSRYERGLVLPTPRRRPVLAESGAPSKLMVAAVTGEATWPEGEIAYFDSSSWNWFYDRPDRAILLDRVRNRRITILASALSAAEIATTRNPSRRRDLCQFMKDVHPESLGLLEHPLRMAKPMAEGILRGEDSYVIPETLLAQEVSAFLSDPVDEETRQGIIDWRKRIETRFQDTIVVLASALKKALEDHNYIEPAPDLMTFEAARSPAMIEALLAVAAQMDLEASEDQMRSIYESPFPTVWSCLPAVWLFVAQLLNRDIGMRHRPGGVDFLHALYMGLPINVFVTDDGNRHLMETGLLAAAKSISTLLVSPCPVLTSAQFFDHLLYQTPLPARR